MRRAPASPFAATPDNSAAARVAELLETAAWARSARIPCLDRTTSEFAAIDFRGLTRPRPARARIRPTRAPRRDRRPRAWGSNHRHGRAILVRERSRRWNAATRATRGLSRLGRTR